MPILITILHVTGASQSLLAEEVIPLSDKTATGDHVLISGVELGYTSVPLHKGLMKSNSVSGCWNMSRPSSERCYIV